jgi:hypothetical protein
MKVHHEGRDEGAEELRNDIRRDLVPRKMAVDGQRQRHAGFKCAPVTPADT